MVNSQIVNIKDSDVLDKMLAIWEYNPKHGKIVNKRTKRPLNGRPNRKNYLRVSIRINGRIREVYYSRAVWALCHEQWPQGEIDHLNADVQDNRIENLRECTSSENSLNKYLPWEPNEDTQIPGVYLNNRKRRSCFKSWIRDRRFFGFSRYHCFSVSVLLGKRYQPPPDLPEGRRYR